MQRVKACFHAVGLHILPPELQIHLCEGVEDQRRNGVAAEEGDAPVIAEQRLGKGGGVLLCGLLRLTLQILQRRHIRRCVVGGQKLHGRTLQIVPQLQDALGGLFVRQSAVIPHNGHQCVQTAGLGIVRHRHALAGHDVQKTQTVQLTKTVMHHRFADLHGVGQLPLGGQLVAGPQLSR